MYSYSWEEITDSQGCECCPNNVDNYETFVDNKPEDVEKIYLDNLVNQHWKYIEELLWAASQSITDEDRIHEIGFHYKSAFKHGWGHAREYHIGDTL